MAKITLTDLQKRKLKKAYLVWYVIPKEVKIRGTSCIEEKILYTIYGIDKFGNRQILGIYFEDIKDNRFWLEVFEDLKDRGAESVMFLVTPNVHNLVRCCKLVYNGIKVVKSPSSVIESITKYFSDRPSRILKYSFKNLFLAEDIQTLNLELQLFKEKYMNNKVVLMLLERKEKEILDFYTYNSKIRKLLYPHSAIHELKKFLNKLNTLEKLCSNISEVMEFCIPYVNKFEIGRTHSKNEWLQLIDILYEIYSDEMEVYIQ